MRNHEQIFKEIELLFEELRKESQHKVNMNRILITLNEIISIENQYAPDWEAAVMNLLVYIGFLSGVVEAGRQDQTEPEIDEEMHKHLTRVYALLASYYANEQE